MTGVTVAEVDEKRQQIAGSSRFVPCDTLLLSIGLIPENELTRQASVAIAPRTSGAFVDDTLMTSVPGIFSCGNVLHVHDLVDHVSEEASRAGVFAAAYLNNTLPEKKDTVKIEPGRGVGYVMPQEATGLQDFTISMRVSQPGRDQYISVRDHGRKVVRKKIICLHPAEMVRIKVKAEKLESAKVLEVGIE